MQWINCKKRLPEVRKIVLVTDGYLVGIGFRGAFGMDEKLPQFFRPVMLDRLYGILAWKPLPKPFKNNERKKVKRNIKDRLKIYSL
jgi:hypothetical protein